MKSRYGIKEYLTKMDKEYGYEIFESDNKWYFRGASTDWCCYPLNMIMKRKIKKEEDMVG